MAPKKQRERRCQPNGLYQNPSASASLHPAKAATAVRPVAAFKTSEYSTESRYRVPQEVFLAYDSRPFPPWYPVSLMHVSRLDAQEQLIEGGTLETSTLGDV